MEKMEQRGEGMKGRRKRSSGEAEAARAKYDVDPLQKTDTGYLGYRRPCSGVNAIKKASIRPSRRTSLISQSSRSSPLLLHPPFRRRPPSPPLLFIHPPLLHLPFATISFLSSFFSFFPSFPRFFKGDPRCEKNREGSCQESRLCSRTLRSSVSSRLDSFRKFFDRSVESRAYAQ